MHAGDLLSKRAQLSPDREALLDLETGRRFTYSELNARANRIANALHDELGIGKGDRVSIFAYNGIEYLDLFYGLAKIGAVFAPLNWRLVARELVYIVNDCKPSVIICGPEFAATLEEMLPDTGVEQVLFLGKSSQPELASYEQLLAGASEAEPGRPPLDADDPYCILYTSGTTGRPKGAMIPHRQVLWNCINTAVSWGLNENDVSPVFTPLFHAGGLFAFLTPLLYLGGRILLARGFDIEASLRDIIDEKCTVILGVPTIFQMWMESPQFEKSDFSHVRFFISGGAPCPPTLMDSWREAKGIVFRQGYGLTEVGPNCFSMSDEDSVPKTGSVGKPVFHSEMKLVDEQGAVVSNGETGELAIKGPHVCSGYWRNPDATADALRDGWFYTGDMAKMDEDGFYFIAGRFKDMIISGGENVYAAEVEAVLLEHPAVTDAALIGKPDEKWGEIGLVFVVLDRGSQISDQELLDFCRGRLARYKVPKQVIFTDSLPYSAYGKVIKAVLKEEYVV
jgi:fatty-acyl-CoA synthase